MMYLYWLYVYPTVSPAGWRGWVLTPNHQSWWNPFFSGRPMTLELLRLHQARQGFVCACELLMSQNHEVFLYNGNEIDNEGKPIKFHNFGIMFVLPHWVFKLRLNNLCPEVVAEMGEKSATEKAAAMQPLAWKKWQSFGFEAWFSCRIWSPPDWEGPGKGRGCLTL